MNKNFDETPLTTLNGVGKRRALFLNKLGIFSVRDLLYYFPRDYEDRRAIKKICELVNGEECTFVAVVKSDITKKKIRKNLTIYKLLVCDGHKMANLTWFNQHYLEGIFQPGEEFLFFGKVKIVGNQIEVTSPVYEKKSEDTKKTCRIVPIYPVTADINQGTMQNFIRSALDTVSGSIVETIPEIIRKRYNLSEINYSIENIHFPNSMEDYENARYRLVFEELLLFQLGMLTLKSKTTTTQNGIQFRPTKELRQLIETLPFSLTEAQKRAFEEIEKDMYSNKVMNRLVQGDVGSGKTIIAVLALFLAVKNRYQGVLMAPTGILAEQHFNGIMPLLEPFGINIELLTGSCTMKQKRRIKEGLKNLEIDILIGTHAVIQEDVEFARLGLVITDEQHRFGVRQRVTLSKKSENPDILVMTATPIPRTLALILYGDLDISVIDQLPPGRKEIKTYSVEEDMRKRIYDFIRKNVNEGRQAYIVCPLVEESESIEAKAAEQLYNTIREVELKGLTVGLIHGKMKNSEKEATMKCFVCGKTKVLVSTTVIEVGVNVPNANIMVIENAERFGLSQLHQLRGRVGRGEHQSFCIMINQSKGKVAKQRMDIMAKTNDGFLISEKDLELRGPGDFFGTRQHGIPGFKIANLYKDMNILKLAQEAALSIMKHNNELSLEENEKLRLRLIEMFRERMQADGITCGL